MDMRLIKQRMEELGLDFAALNKKYCELRRQKGDANATPNRRRGMLARIFNEESDPSLQTLQDLIEVLEGEIVIRWVKTQEVPVSSLLKESLGESNDD